MRAHVFLKYKICLFDFADLQRVHGREDLRSASKCVRWAIALMQCLNLLYNELPDILLQAYYIQAQFPSY